MTEKRYYPLPKRLGQKGYPGTEQAFKDLMYESMRYVDKVCDEAFAPNLLRIQCRRTLREYTDAYDAGRIDILLFPDQDYEYIGFAILDKSLDAFNQSKTAHVIRFFVKGADWDSDGCRAMLKKLKMFATGNGFARLVVSDLCCDGKFDSVAESVGLSTVCKTFSCRL